MFFIWFIEYFKDIIVGVNSQCNLCFTIFIYWWCRPLPLLRQIFKILFCCFFSFEPNHTAAFYLHRLLYLQTIYANWNLWTYSFLLLWLKGCSPDRKLFHTLFELSKSNQFKFVFTMNHGSNVWLCLSFNRIVQTVFTKLRSVDHGFTVFLAAKSQYIVWNPLNVWAFLLWFTRRLNVNHM